MKRIAFVCAIVIGASILIGSFSDATAQSIKVHRIGISANQAKIMYPGVTWTPISNGLRAIGRGTTAYFQVDTTGSGETGAPTWTLGAPGGSTATLDSVAGSFVNSFTADLVGTYIVGVTVGALSAADTVYASTYVGITSAGNAGCVCHGEATNIKTSWEETGHAKIFTEGIIGELEVDEVIEKGAYAPGCIRCHTTGSQADVDNGNFGYLAHTIPAPSPNSWDSTWWIGLETSADGRDFLIPAGDSTILNALPVELKPTSYIGCESCHGPAGEHTNFASGEARKMTIGRSLSSDVCNQCHDGSGRHSIGSMARPSLHATVPEGGHTGRTSCFPCHSGSAFVKWVNAGKDGSAAGWSADADGGSPISCAVCHNPHGENDPANPWHLRTLTLDSLLNGFVPPAGEGGFGVLCMNCHHARYSVKDRVQPNNPPYYGFTNRHGPHESPQADMFLGTGGYQYGELSFEGIATHAGLENSCATCHMSGRPSLPNHQWSMDPDDYEGTTFNPFDACRDCHGTITSYDDIQAFFDFDGDGTIEGTQSEIQGLMDQLKASLPIDSDPTSDHFGEPVYYDKDSLLVKGQPEYVEGIWNYYFVKADGSMGVHNAKYAAALLRKTLGLPIIADVEVVDGRVPSEYALSQNYPNPFNPTTNLSFSLPRAERVTIQIYDVVGDLVKTLIDQTFAAGTFSVTWDGTDNAGARTASGMYIYRMQAGSFAVAKKMLMLK